MIRPTTLMLALALIGGTAACGEEEGGTAGGGGGGGGGGPAVIVGPGLAPAYNWNGGLADSIYVVRASNATTKVWGIRATTSPDGFGPIVTHGTTPAETETIVSTEPTLTEGVTYRVFVARQSGGTVSLNFTP
jgi:hypothetical protein